MLKSSCSLPGETGRETSWWDQRINPYTAIPFIYSELSNQATTAESALKQILVVIDVSTAELLPPPASDDGPKRGNRAHVDRTESDAQIVLSLIHI